MEWIRQWFAQMNECRRTGFTSRCFWMGLTAVWCALLVFVAWPRWQRAIAQHGEIAQLEQQLQELDRWSVAGLWLERAVELEEPAVNARWDRLFPPARGREQLFLDLARVADRSRVEQFSLSEVTDMGMPAEGGWQTEGSAAAAGPGAGAAAADAPPTDGGADPMAVPAPQVKLDSYRVKAGFSGDYARTAEFLAGLRDITRALNVRNLVARPVRDGIYVELELEIYVGTTS